MAIQENLNDIRQEIGAQEQFLESIIKGERAFKKYKKLIIAACVVAIAAVTWVYAQKFIDKGRVKEANEAYSKLIANPSDEAALKILKDKEPSLYALYKFKQDMQKSDVSSAKELLALPIDPLVKQIISAQIGEQSGGILADYNALLKGYGYLKENKINEARSEFSKIPLDSQLNNLVKNLQHYQGNKQ